MDTKKIGEFIAACRKEKGMTQKELADALGITNRAVSINKKPIKWKKKISAKCLLGALACFAAAFLALSMQIVYLTLGKRYQMEYIYDFLPYIVNIAAIGSFFAGIYFLTKGSRKIQKLVAGICILFLVINAVFWIKDLKTMRTSIIRISPGYKKMLILKKKIPVRCQFIKIRNYGLPDVLTNFHIRCRNI